MDKLELDDKIDRYVLGQMDKQEHEEFSSLIAQDVDIAKMVEHRKITLQALREVNNEELKKKLKAHEQQKHTRSRRLVYYAIAASVSIIAISSYLINNYSSDPLAKYDVFEEGIPNLMGANDEIAFHNGMSAFKMEEYEKCMEIYSNLAESDTIIYHMGVAQYRLEEYDQAIKEFRKLISTQSRYRYKADYRLLLSLIQVEEYDEAKRIIASIKENPSHPFRKQAMELEVIIEQ